MMAAVEKISEKADGVSEEENGDNQRIWTVTGTDSGLGPTVTDAEMDPHFELDTPRLSLFVHVCSFLTEGTMEGKNFCHLLPI
jgi:hypothetical protein